MAEDRVYEMGNREFENEFADQKYQADEQDVNDQGDGENVACGGCDALPASDSAEAPGRDDDRKLFVGGLSWDTTENELGEYFQTYGEIESIIIKTDPSTGRSRGFSFIIFSSAESIGKVLNAGDHIINNKRVDPKKANARHKKIFVGGLVPEILDGDIRSFFAQYGKIVDVETPFDKTKNQRKGYCFITFESEQVVQELLKSPKQFINGKEVQVKRVTTKTDGMGGMRGGRSARGCRGRGRGGRGTRGGGYSGQGWRNQSYSGNGSYDQGYGSYDYYGSGYGNYEGYGNYDYTGYSGYGNYADD